MISFFFLFLGTTPQITQKLEETLNWLMKENNQKSRNDNSKNQQQQHNNQDESLWFQKMLKQMYQLFSVMGITPGK